jgi:protein O-GlcNAc transferase
MKDVVFAEALTHHRAGRISEAEALYRAILDRDPDHADSLHLLGLITVEHADPEDGIALIRRAMAMAPDLAPHYNSLGHAYRRLGRPEDAVRAYRTAAELRPESAEIHNNLATTLRDLGRHQEAIAHYRQATVLAPEIADIWYNLANALAPTGASVETESCYGNAIRLKPDFADAHANYGRWLMAQGRWVEAGIRLDAALRLAPMNAGTWNNLGIVSQELGGTDAEACYHNALEIDPALADAHYNLGCLRFDHGDSEAAIVSYDAAIASDPQFGLARLAACMAQLPILYKSAAEVSERRQRYAVALERLVAGDARVLAPVIGRSQPFFLPYQGEDDRALQSAYGQFACGVLAEAELAENGQPAPLAARPLRGERIRLGIVCGFFCDHTLFKLFLEGWLRHLDRRKFEVIGLHTGRLDDAYTARCADLCDRFLHRLSSAALWRQAIVELAPHVLLYPEVGIDPIAGRLAAMRLAPVQCVTWGQPETTGMPTMDYFLSSDLMEPPDADAYYTERLVRVPNLGLCYLPDEVGLRNPAGSAPPDAPTRPVPIRHGGTSEEPAIEVGIGHPPPPVVAQTAGTATMIGEASLVPTVAAASLGPLAVGGHGDQEPGLSEPVFWSGQALYKYLPQYDAVFPRIAAELGSCRFVFVAFAKSQAVTDAFRDRMGQAFAAAGLDAAEHVVILPAMSQADYLKAVGQADVILDTIGWSGGKSTLDCLALDPAIVTLPGRLMRGRHTAAILRWIGSEATIAGSLDEYVAIAVRLARDPSWLAEVRQAVAGGKHRAFDDLAYVRALENFLTGAVAGSETDPRE